LTCAIQIAQNNLNLKQAEIYRSMNIKLKLHIKSIEEN